MGSRTTCGNTKRVDRDLDWPARVPALIATVQGASGEARRKTFCSHRRRGALRSANAHLQSLARPRPH